MFRWVPYRFLEIDLMRICRWAIFIVFSSDNFNVGRRFASFLNLIERNIEFRIFICPIWSYNISVVGFEMIIVLGTVYSNY